MYVPNLRGEMDCRERTTTRMSPSMISSGALFWLLVAVVITTVSLASGSSDSDCAEHKDGDEWTEYNKQDGTCSGWRCDDGTAMGLPCAPFVITEESGCWRVPGNSTAQYPQCCETAECPPRCFSTALSTFFKPQDIWQENGVWKTCVLNGDNDVPSIIHIAKPNITDKSDSKRSKASKPTGKYARRQSIEEVPSGKPDEVRSQVYDSAQMRIYKLSVDFNQIVIDTGNKKNKIKESHHAEM